MGLDSAIEWTEATWNPTTGCTKISPGCANCYAERLTKRLQMMGVKKYERGFQFVQHNDDLYLPLTWRKSKKIFVNSMSDLFHEKSDFEFVKKCFFSMIMANWHTYQILTKRPQRMARFSNLFETEFKIKIPHHIWMGTSIESENYNWRIDELRRVRCHARFISFEPLIGDVGQINLEGVDWIIIGGESGYGFRQVKKDWIKNIVKQCKQQDVAVFFKQWGGIRPKSGGRELDGKTFDEYPQIQVSEQTKSDELALKKKIEQIAKQEQTMLIPKLLNR